MQTRFYFIRSDSRPNLFHRVSETAGRYRCECEDFSFRARRAGRDCRHIDQIRRGCGLVAQPKRPAPATVSVSAAGRELQDALQV